MERKETGSCGMLQWTGEVRGGPVGCMGWEGRGAVCCNGLVWQGRRGKLQWSGLEWYGLVRHVALARSGRAGCS
jgi:hypothetical protein